MSEVLTVTNKSVFSRDSLIWLRIVIFIQLIFLGCQVSFVVIQFYNKPVPVYFPLNKSDQLINDIPLDKPGLTDAELLNWITEAMIVSFSFNYHNYENISEKIDEYFDSAGIDSYLKMITTNTQVQKVVSNKLILSGRPTAAPRIAQDGVVDGRYAWQVLLPFVLKFNNQKTKIDQELTLEIFIVRTPDRQAPLGVKVVAVQDSRDSEQKTQKNNVLPQPLAPSGEGIGTGKGVGENK